MGHTVWSQRITIDLLLSELEDYGKALRKEEREVLLDLLKRPLKHLGSISYASSLHAWAFLLLAINVEQEKRIKTLENELAHRYIPDKGCDHPLAQN